VSRTRVPSGHARVHPHCGCTFRPSGFVSVCKVIDEYRTRLIEAAGRHGKDVSMLVGSIEQSEQWIRAGAKIICYSSEVEILRRGIMEAAKRLHAVR
jgi:2-keto-3-deoxy-L-rhamnonate aldolase RhmA